MPKGEASFLGAMRLHPGRFMSNNTFEGPRETKNSSPETAILGKRREKAKDPDVAVHVIRVNATPPPAGRSDGKLLFFLKQQKPTD